MYLLGIDLGTSAIKVSLFDPATGQVVGAAQDPPDSALPVFARQPGWAEQDPAHWWASTCRAVRAALTQAGPDAAAGVAAIGITYQMHGLVCLDAAGEVLRPCILWCDSRAVGIGDAARDALGAERCLRHLLNHPGNFTASRLRWVQEHEPAVYARIARIGLPGDWLAYRLTGRMATTVSGLSEGMFWDFQSGSPAAFLLDHWRIDPALLAERVPTFGPQGELSLEAATALGLRAGTPVTYRAGDQPNNALSLGVLAPGEVAATAGTSGVIYGVSDAVRSDPASRVNTFAHVTHAADRPVFGTLLCLNGAGSAMGFLRRMLGGSPGFAALSDQAAAAPIGSDGLVVLPFGNGAERMLANSDPGAHLCGLAFNTHTPAHLARAVQEGVVFAFAWGLDLLRKTGLEPAVIRAGRANMFLSPVFRQTLATAIGVPIALYETDGSVGAARGAGIGAGLFATPEAAFDHLQRLAWIEPVAEDRAAVHHAGGQWRETLERVLAAVAPGDTGR